MKTYLTTGKREMIRQGYQAQVNAWAKLAGVRPPLVEVRMRVGGVYYRAKSLISMPPTAEVSSLVHEFAHHLSEGMGYPRGHGPHFRVALVAAATLHYGRPDLYPWRGEYATVKAWARRHGLWKEVVT